MEQAMKAGRTPEQKALLGKLVDALNSGKYKQAQNTLAVKQEDGTVSYCCLGVGCDISGKGKWVPASRDYDCVADKLIERAFAYVVDVEDAAIPTSQKRDSNYMPAVLEQEFGLDRDLDTRHLAMLNDALKLRFEQIADIIWFAAHDDRRIADVSIKDMYLHMRKNFD